MTIARRMVLIFEKKDETGRVEVELLELELFNRHDDRVFVKP